jgi:hypothetical protein
MLGLALLKVKKKINRTMSIRRDINTPPSSSGMVISSFLLFAWWSPLLFLVENASMRYLVYA